MRTKDEGLDTREQLLRGAISVISAKGLRGLTLRAAAAEAGLTHGMIVHHFGTRERLVEAAMEFAAERSLSGAVPVAATSERPSLGDHVVEVGNDTEGAVAFQREVLNEAMRNPRLRPLAEQMYTQYESVVRAQLEAQGVFDPDAAILVGAAMDGLVRRQMDIGDAGATERAVALLGQIVTMLRVGAPARSGSE